MSERSESDRLQRESWLQRMLRRPEIGSFVVMIIIILALAFASNGKAFNALGLKNNIAIIAQLGIIAVGAECGSHYHSQTSMNMFLMVGSRWISLTAHLQ